MFFCLLLGCLISLLIIPLMLLPRLKRSLFAPPTPSPHSREHSADSAGAAVPRLGGVALAVAFVAVLAFIGLVYPVFWRDGTQSGFAILWSGLAVFLAGLWDEFRPMRLGWRLALQSVLVVPVYLQGVRIESFSPPLLQIECPLGHWSGVVTVLWLVALTNAFSRMDTIKHLAGGLGLILTALLAFLGVGAGSGLQAMCAIGMSGALLGFLVYNLPPTRISLGGAGAGFVGFLIGTLSLLHHGREGSSAGLLVVALPLLGAALVAWCQYGSAHPLLPSLSGAAQRRVSSAVAPRSRARS